MDGRGRVFHVARCFPKRKTNQKKTTLEVKITHR
jgi:hypothetical protein